jgi:hypothetical protein
MEKLFMEYLLLINQMSKLKEMEKNLNFRIFSRIKLMLLKKILKPIIGMEY